MGRTTNETVDTMPSNDVAKVKVSKLREFYEGNTSADPVIAPHSPQEVADEFNVEVSVVMEALKLHDQGEDLDAFNQPVADDEPDANAPAE